MPRINQGRTINVEPALARRIAYERDRRGMSNEQLARAMADVGCPIQPTAIYKIEKAEPPRRVTVTELVAFARVFEMEVSDLLQPVEIAMLGEAKNAFTRWTTAWAASEIAKTELVEAELALSNLMEASSSAKAAVVEAVRTWMAGQGVRDDDEAVVAFLADITSRPAFRPEIEEAKRDAERLLAMHERARTRVANPDATT